MPSSTAQFHNTPSTVHDAALVESCGRLTGEQFVELFKSGVVFLLKRAGYRHQDCAEDILGRAYVRVNIAGSWGTQEMAATVRQEVSTCLSNGRSPKPAQKQNHSAVTV